MELNTLTYIAIMLVAALLAGKVVKVLKLPNVTGYLVIGLLLGPHCLKVFSEDLLNSMSIITEFALGCIAFSIGAEFKISFLRKVGKAPIVIGVLEGLGAVMVVDTILLLLGYDVTFALAMGAIASATAAASTLMIVKQYKAKGPVTRTLLPVVALDDAVALLAFGLSMAAANVISSHGSAPIGKLLMDPFIEIIGGLAFGAILGLVMVYAVKFYTGRGNRLAITIMMICLCVGVSDLLGFSSLLACMMQSLVFVNLSRYREKIYEPLDRITPPIYMMFFIISGASLDVTIITSVGVVGVVYVIGRVIGKWVGSWLGARISKAPKIVSKWLGFTLVPQEGVAIGLATSAASSLPEYGSKIRTIVLCGVVVYELIGPIITKTALKKAGEIQG
ncbi:MAG: cation:proton antiporter [Eubacteriales bacterium]|nr:cation:proton antiporter [Lachnospiraceae bacterium]MDO5127562.1 cation:proton antiporter [Eubacteriales bacterium]